MSCDNELLRCLKGPENDSTKLRWTCTGDGSVGPQKLTDCSNHGKRKQPRPKANYSAYTRSPMLVRFVITGSALAVATSYSLGTHQSVHSQPFSQGNQCSPVQYP